MNLSHYIKKDDSSSHNEEEKKAEEKMKRLADEEEATQMGDEYGDSILLFGSEIGEVVHVSSERDYGKFSNIQATNGAWHSCSKDNVLAERRRRR